MFARRLLAVSLAALEAAPMAAAKPPAPDSPDAPREEYRGQGVSMCVAELRGVETITPDQQEMMCGCAFDRFMANRATAALPPLEAGGIARAMGGELLGCAALEDSELAAAVARFVAQAAMRPPPSPTAVPLPEAIGEPAKPPPEADAAGFDLRRWFEGLSVRRWLSGLPLWAWLPIVLFGLIRIWARFRGTDSRRDLMGPPRSMRPGTHLGPPPRR